MISFEALGAAILEAATDALGQGAVIVEQRAKARAPVRNIFGVEHSFVPNKMITEVQQALASRGELGKAAEMWANAEMPHTKAVANNPRNWRERRLRSAKRLLLSYDAANDARRRGYPPQKTMLSRQGAYEVRTKRAKFTTFEHAGIGGRLRGEIYSTTPRPVGKQVEAWVISPTEYAKYQEYGTRHNRAHPFLRPAAEESREEVISLIAGAVKEASRTGVTDTVIDIVVRI